MTEKMKDEFTVHIPEQGGGRTNLTTLHYLFPLPQPPLHSTTFSTWEWGKLQWSREIGTSH